MNSRGKRLFSFDGAVITGLFLLMVAGMWLSSGNFAPYSATLTVPALANEQGIVLDSAAARAEMAQGKPVYMVNYDQGVYLAMFYMLDGQSRELWGGNIVQRRILFYLPAYPFMKLFGFSWGALMTTVLITLGAVAYAYIHVRKWYGRASGLLFVALMATYPGITYWCGTGYAQVVIVPLCLVFFVKMKQYEDEPSARNALWLSVVLGIGFLGYDLASYFLPASILLFCYKKQWKHLLFVPLMLIPSVLLNLYYIHIGFELINDNTGVYRYIFMSYADMTPAIFWKNLKALPAILYHNYLDSQFLYTGLLGLGVSLLTLLWGKQRFLATGVVILLSVLAVHLFANMAPPYDGPWRLRGTPVARLYQSFFVVIVFAAAAAMSDKQGKPVLAAWAKALVILTFLFNAAVVFSPALGYFGQTWIYENIYINGPPGTMEKNIRRYGARPLGL